MKKRMIAFCSAMVLCMALPLAADAAQYVCMVYRAPSWSPGGTAGATIATIYDGPNCSGSYLQQLYYCSPGATSSNCTSISSYYYSDNGLNTLWKMFSTAADFGQQVYAYTSSCIGGGTGCGYAVYFYGY